MKGQREYWWSLRTAAGFRKWPPSFRRGIEGWTLETRIRHARFYLAQARRIREAWTT